MLKRDFKTINIPKKKKNSCDLEKPKIYITLLPQNKWLLTALKEDMIEQNRYRISNVVENILVEHYKNKQEDIHVKDKLGS